MSEVMRQRQHLNTTTRRTARLRMLCAGLFLSVVSVALGSCEQEFPETEAKPPALRLLTEDQYRNIISDIFGSHIVVAGRFDPMFRTNGLLTLGARSAEITPTAMESYEKLAQLIAGQVVSAENRRAIMPCAPIQDDAADEACSAQAIGNIGKLLYRRPLTEVEKATVVAIAIDASDTANDFYAGLKAALTRMLVSPDFLFIADQIESDSSRGTRLSSYAIASRLSFFLWNTAPDAALLDAAARGDLSVEEGRAKQVDRMLASPLLVRATRNFFGDLLHLDDLAVTEKDALIYPSFNVAVTQDAREQTLRTITHLLIDQDGDYRNLYTTRDTFVSAPLGIIYQVPVTRPDGGWTAYSFPEGDARVGLLSQVAFSALHSHAGRSSPTLRGKAIREILLCQKVPDPPGDVDFTLFNDPNTPHRTARERLTAHATEPACAGCHKLTDPIGLGMEKLDGAGQLRDTESGAPIITTGDFDGVPFTDIESLGQALRANPAVPACLVNRLYSVGLSRTPEPQDRTALDYLTSEFERDGYRIRPLLRAIAVSDAFIDVSQPKIAAADLK